MYLGPVGALCQDAESAIARLLGELDRNLRTNYSELTVEEVRQFSAINQAVQQMSNGFQTLHRKLDVMRDFIERRQQEEAKQPSNSGNWTGTGWTTKKPSK